MPTNSQPASERGVWRLHRPEKPSAHGVQWRENIWDSALKKEKRRTFTEFFHSEEDREKRVTQLLARKRKGLLNTPSPAELRDWRAFAAATEGVPWQTVVGGYHSWLVMTGQKPCTVSVEAHAETYLAQCLALTKKNPPEMSVDNLRHKERVLRDFVAGFGHLMLNQVIAEEVEDWIDDFEFASAETFNSWVKHLKAFFNSAVPRALSENPISTIEKREHTVDNRRAILSPQECAQLFHFAREHRTFRRLLALGALEAFAGLRFSSAQRIERADVHMDDATFFLPAAKLKTGRTSGSHLVDTTNLPGLEPVWEWLKLAPAEAWTLTPTHYMKMKSEWFTAAGVRHPRNTLRKSFATYDLAAHRNPGRTAYILGHTNQGKLWDTYKGNATRSAALLYQWIVPWTVRGIAGGELTQAPNPPQIPPMHAGGF